MNFSFPRNLSNSVVNILHLGGLFSLSAITIALTSAHAHAAILSATENINSKFNPPPAGISLLEGDIQNNRFIFAFNEQQKISVSGLALDIIDIAETNLVDGTDKISPGYIERGEVNSHILHFDPNQTRLDYPLSLGGAITFEENIVGIMVLSETLDLSDSLLGLKTILYPTGIIDNPPGRNRRGLGFGEVDEDIFEFIQIVDSNTIALDLTALKSVDQVRVITSNNAVINASSQPVPEPSIVGALILGCMLGISTAQRSKVRHLS